MPGFHVPMRRRWPMPNHKICSQPHASVLLRLLLTSELRGAKSRCVIPNWAARSISRLYVTRSAGSEMSS